MKTKEVICGAGIRGENCSITSDEGVKRRSRGGTIPEWWGRMERGGQRSGGGDGGEEGGRGGRGAGKTRGKKGGGGRGGRERKRQGEGRKGRGEREEQCE